MYTRPILTVCTLFCLAVGAQAQTPVALSPVPAQQFLSNAGVPLAQGCVYTSISGTSTPLATYTDGTGTAQNTNPVILDAGGFGNIWLSNSSYRFTVYSYGSGAVGANCGNGVFQRTVDNVSAYAIINQAQNLFLAGAGSDPGGSAGELAYRTDIPCFRGFTTFWDCFVRLTDTQTLTNKTLTSPTITGTVTGAGATITNVGLTNPVVGGVLMPTPSTYALFPNDTVTGTVTSKLVKLTGAAGSAILPTTGDTGGVVGIAISGAGNGFGTNVTVEQSGVGTGCIFDGATTANDYVQISSTIAGDCHDAGAGFPTNGQVIGRVLSTGGGVGSLVSVLLFPPEIRPGGGAFPGCTAIGPVTVSNTVALSTLLSCSIPANTLSAGSLLAVDLTGIESTASGQQITFTFTLGGGTPCATAASTLGVANNQPIYTWAKFALLTAGAGGTANWSCGFVPVGNSGYVGPFGTVGAPTISINTTISNTLLVQVTMSVANAGNTTTAQLLKSVVF